MGWLESARIGGTRLAGLLLDQEFGLLPYAPVFIIAIYGAAAAWRNNRVLASAIALVVGGYLIAAARNPSEYRSLISFTVWSSIVHAGIMAVQSISDGHEMGHLVGDVPALLLVAAVLWFLSPAKRKAPVTA